MATLKLDNGKVNYQWSSDVDFHGIRLEVLADEVNILFDISISDDGHITVNTFGKEVSAKLIEAAIELTRRP